VNNIFLDENLDEEIYMSSLLSIVLSPSKQVHILRKFLYGLKQASRQWTSKLTQTLASTLCFSAKLNIPLQLYSYMLTILCW